MADSIGPLMAALATFSNDFTAFTTDFSQFVSSTKIVLQALASGLVISESDQTNLNNITANLTNLDATVKGMDTTLKGISFPN